MKTKAFLINVARGGIINETDLALILSEEKIAGAAIDVFKQEPVEKGNPLLNINKPTHEYISLFIMDYLNAEDLLNLQLVSKNFYILGKNNKFWNKIFVSHLVKHLECLQVLLAKF